MAGIFMFLALFSSVFAQEAASLAEEAPKYADLAAFSESPGFTLFTVNNVWMMLATALVFIMHLGFATVESGLTQ